MFARTEPTRALLAALNDPERAPAAARALGRRPERGVAKALIARYDPLAVSWRTWQWHPARGKDVAAHFAKLPKARALRLAIIVALGDLGSSALELALEPVPTRFLPGDLVQIARRIGPPARASLEAMLAGHDRRRVASAVRILRALGDPAAIPALLPLLDHRAWSLSDVARRALLHLGRRDPAALEAALQQAQPALYPQAREILRVLALTGAGAPPRRP